jgi:FkbM family methyltransferase
MKRSILNNDRAKAFLNTIFRAWDNFKRQISRRSNSSATINIEKYLEIDKMENSFGKIENQAYYSELLSRAFRGLNFGYEALDNGEKTLLLQLRTQIGKTSEIIHLFDVGANIGLYTRQLISCFRASNVIIHSFEPSKYAFDKLKEKFEGSPRLLLNNVALSNKNGKAKLFSDVYGSGMASLTKRKLEYRNIEMKYEEEVNLLKLSEYVAKNRISRIFLLKIDTEGHELEVLQGGKKLIQERRIEHIQFEFGGTNIDTRTFLKDFYSILGKNYDIFRIVKNGIYALGSYSEELEIFRYANYYARLKY